jgi:alginate O-acetyltransferase complex protein AlgI
MIQKIFGILEYNQSSPMIFSSGLFLFLFLFFLLIYSLLQKKQIPRLIFVTIFSYYFYYKSSGIYFFLLALVTISDYIIGRNIGKCRKDNPQGKILPKLLVTISVIIDLAFLFYFKYTNFFCGLIAKTLGNNFQPFDIFLPVGISFFTFQSLSYTIDIYRKQIHPLQNLLDYAFYVSFFPQLVAGPIVRAKDFIYQIRQPIYISKTMFSRGIYLIILGLFKKAVISDYISINYVERIFDNPNLYSGIENLLGVYGYTLQIYCDFSGYSDMAIGIALLLGFRFPINFNSPYCSESVTDFWHRWHISLSTWLKDYLYIPLGGNRKGKIRTYINLILTMLLGGLWHGANLNFVVWGGMHGLALGCHKFLRQQILNRDKCYHSLGWRKIIAVILTFHFVCFTWIFFRNTSFDGSYDMIKQIFTNFHGEIIFQIIHSYKSVFVLIIFGYLTHFIPDSIDNRIIAYLSKVNIITYAVLITCVIFIVIQIKSTDIQPFIYFQF